MTRESAAERSGWVWMISSTDCRDHAVTEAAMEAGVWLRVHAGAGIATPERVVELVIVIREPWAVLTAVPRS